MKIRTGAAALGLAVILSGAAFAEEAAKIFAARCTGCHGPSGAGKAALKGTNLLSDEARKKSDADLAAAIAEGGASKKAAHAFGKKGLAASDVEALVKHVRTLQKK